MTCIVGITTDNGLYLGADSATTAGYQVQALASHKVFRLGEFLFGVCGYVRLLQILRHRLQLPPLWPNQSLDNYMNGPFVDAVRQACQESGFTQYWGGQEVAGGAFLVGRGRRLFSVGPDFAVMEIRGTYNAIGSGSDLALGSLHSSEEWTDDPKERIYAALRAAARYNAGVAPPFVMISNVSGFSGEPEVIQAAASRTPQLQQSLALTRVQGAMSLNHPFV